jgi:hypothetical protein
MTGDASDTTLALSQSPGSENNVSITLDGVMQHHDTYSLSGSTITFSTAPATGVKVEAVSGGLESIGTPSDGTVTLAKMAAESVDEDNLHISNSGSNGQFLSKQSGDAGGLTWAAAGGTPDDDTVTSAKIVNGAIVNADINASAAIDNSKIKTSDLPCFFALDALSATNVTGAGATYAIDLATEIFDTGSNFASDTFTAPVAGKYLLIGQIRLLNLTTAADATNIQIVTSNRTHVWYWNNTNNNLGENRTNLCVCIADMDASDTVSMTAIVTGESSNVVDVGGHASEGRTFFSGCLLSRD